MCSSPPNAGTLYPEGACGGARGTGAGSQHCLGSWLLKNQKWVPVTSDAFSGSRQLCSSQLSTLLSQCSPAPCLELHCEACGTRVGTQLSQAQILDWSWEPGQNSMLFILLSPPCFRSKQVCAESWSAESMFLTDLLFVLLIFILFLFFLFFSFIF